MLDKITASQFQDLIGTKAEVTVLDGPNVNLTLVDVTLNDTTKGECPPEGCRPQSFSLGLTGPQDHQAKDGTYGISFEKLGLLEGIYLDNKADLPTNPDEATETNTAEGSAEGESMGQSVRYEIIFS